MIMKKNIKKVLVCFLAVLCSVGSAVSVHAETIYYYFGFNYTIVNNYSVSVCGWDNSDSSVVIPETINNRNVINIDNHAFANNSFITDVSFDEALWLKRIGIFAFSGCESLKAVTIPEQVNDIGMGAFQNCSSLETINYDAKMSIVPQQCFYSCESLKNVYLSDTVTTIEAFAFANCSELRYLELSSNVTSIDESAFTDSNVTLGVYYNTDAHLFAENNGFNYVILDPENIPTEPPTESPTDAPTEAPTDAPTEAPTELNGYYLGDVDGNGAVDTVDAAWVQRYLALFNLADWVTIDHADIDGDNNVSILDVTLIKRYDAQFEIDYPVGEWVTIQ